MSDIPASSPFGLSTRAPSLRRIMLATDLSPATDLATDWAFELGSPNGLMRQGWTRNSLKAGDVVTVLGSRARDGSSNSNARSVTMADGKRLFAGSSEGSTP